MQYPHLIIDTHDLILANSSTSDYINLLSLPSLSSTCIGLAMAHLPGWILPQACAFQHLITANIELGEVHVLHRRVLAVHPTASVSTWNRSRTSDDRSFPDIPPFSTKSSKLYLTCFPPQTLWHQILTALPYRSVYDCKYSCHHASSSRLAA